MKVITAENYPVQPLKDLWKKVLGDSDRYISLFFETKFRPENTFIIDNHGLCSMAFATEEKTENFRCAYICGVATDENSRGRGYAGMIIEHIKRVFRDRGFDFIFLIPASESLFGYYKKYGFENFSEISKRTISKGSKTADEAFSTEFDYEKLNRFYKDFFGVSSVMRSESSFRTIHECYGNLRIYKSGYIIYYAEKDTVFIAEHTLENIDLYANSLMHDTNCKKAEITEFSSHKKPFTMGYFFTKPSFSSPVYINLMLN